MHPKLYRYFCLFAVFLLITGSTVPMFSQVPVAVMPTPKFQFLDANGAPLAGGFVYTCVAGSSCGPSGFTAQTTYAAVDSSGNGASVNPNPITLDSAGEASIFIPFTSFKVAVTDKNGVVQYTTDNLRNQGTNVSGLIVTCSAGQAITSISSSLVAACSSTSSTITKSCLNILDYGGSRDGSTSNNAAWTALLAASVSGQVCAYFPPGSYAFASTPTWTAGSAIAAITIKGDGANISKLIFPSGINGFSLSTIATSNAVKIQGLTFITAGAGNADAISVLGTGTTMAEGVVSGISDNAFYGQDCEACTDYWAHAMVLQTTLVWKISDNKVVGSPTLSATSGLGIGAIISTTTAAVPVVFNFSGNSWDYVAKGIVLGNLVQGVTVNHDNFTGAETGIHVPAGEIGLDELLVTNSQFNAHSNGILLESPFLHTSFQNNLFIVPVNANGILNSLTSTFSITNNFFYGLGINNNGVGIGTWHDGLGMISGNTFQNLNGGIALLSGSQHVTVPINNFSGNVLNESDLGTNNVLGSNCLAGVTAGAVVVINGMITHC